MFPASFDYVAPRSLEEALAELDEKGEEAKVVAGGQSLIPLMKLRFAEPGMLVDLNRIGGLAGIEEADDALALGALVRHNDVAFSEVVNRSHPLIASAAPQIADPLVRNMGTLCGSLCHADPAGDWGSVMLALGAQVTATSSSGRRTIPIDDFLVDTFTTSLQPNEMVTEVRVPGPRGSSGGAYLKLERKVGDFATVGVAVQLELSNGAIGRAGIGLTAVGPSNIRAAEAESALAGAAPDGEAFEEAAQLAARAAEPGDDVRGSADYKRAVVAAFVKRGLVTALELARRA
jgi:carbon-monoxide dehydrogenase medium subunit